MKEDVAKYVKKCLICQQVKVEHQQPVQLLQPLEVLEWKWEHVRMDFIVGFSKSIKGQEAIWVIIDRLTMFAHFLPVRMAFSKDKFAQLYVKEAVELHGALVSIVCDRDRRFTSHFWKSLHQAIGTELNFSTSFHPQTDRQSKWTIQTLEYGRHWEKYLP